MIVVVIIKMTNKKEYGQFFTTNYKYILQNLYIPEDTCHIIEPFSGNCDLLPFITNQQIKIECYDIEPANDTIIQRDTLLNPPNYNNKFVLTNPPYLARNKSKNKEVYDKYNQNDLYKCFIQTLINNECLGGILIIPLNFWSSIRKSDVLLRRVFLEKYGVLQLNIFEEKVFNDTSYTICSFQFELNRNVDCIKCMIYPSNTELVLNLSDNNNYTIGGELYGLSQNSSIQIERATQDNMNDEGITNILLKCIDDSTKICMNMVSSEERYIDTTVKLSARSYATLIINPKLCITDQEMLVEKFNIYLNVYRDRYKSLFLTNYREGNRKRISFGLAFKIVNYLLSN
jgi:hypothetical protein